MSLRGPDVRTRIVRKVISFPALSDSVLGAHKILEVFKEGNASESYQHPHAHRCSV